MERRMPLPAAALATALLCGTGGPLVAQEEVWLTLLREQLLEDKRCRLNYTTNVRRFELGGQQAVEARAHCTDERMFDVVWRPREQRFEIRACEPATC